MSARDRASVATQSKRGLLVLAIGHCCTDICQGAVPAMVPFLVAERGYSVGSASVLVVAVTISSSVVQPAFGYISDLRSVAWLLPAGCVVAGLGIGLAGVMPSYWLTVLVVAAGGFGIAAYHPEGSRYASYLSTERRATAMSLFSVGGNVGFALGPVLMAGVTLLFGLDGTLLIGLIAIAAGGLIARELVLLRSLRPPLSNNLDDLSPRSNDWGSFTKLVMVIGLRSSIYFGLSMLVPLYFVERLGASKQAANLALAVMLTAGAIGTLIGGRLGDRIGVRNVLLGSLAVLSPLILWLGGSSSAVATILLVPIGGCTIATFAITVVMAQDYLPDHIGVASGFAYGLAMGLGGLAAAGLGVVVDAAGVRDALLAVALAPVIAVSIALTLPRHGAPLDEIGLSET